MKSLFKFYLWKLRMWAAGKRRSHFIDNKKLIEALKRVQG